jgi:hypothetical protein
MTEQLFAPGLVDQLRGEYEGVDVHAIAAAIRTRAKRKPVHNPDGMLVQRVHAAARQQAVALGTAADHGELDRYAKFHAALYRDTAIDSLGPKQVADRLDKARRGGFPRLNPFVIDALRALGDAWPDGAAPC